MVLGRMDSSSAVDARPAVVFEYAGRFGHFLRAEASVSALSYPVPPRTALLGMIRAVLGLEKDTPQVKLKDASSPFRDGFPRPTGTGLSSARTRPLRCQRWSKPEYWA